jgi:hypothetical protein
MKKLTSRYPWLERLKTINLRSALYQWVERMRAQDKLPKRRFDQLDEPFTWMRRVFRGIMTLIITGFLMPVAGMLLTYPGGIIKLTAEFLVLANQSLGGKVPFEQLLAALAGGLIVMINFTILSIYVIAEPVYASDISDQLLKLDEVLAERIGSTQYTLDEEIIRRLDTINSQIDETIVPWIHDQQKEKGNGKK